MNYDIIGDIHGHADKLHALLKHLGYQVSVESEGYKKAGHTAVFVGDFIDRGTQQWDSVMTVRRMVDTGSAHAIMGNHEFNAIAWHTPDPACPGEFLRPHNGCVGKKNRKQHVEFLAAVENTPRHKEAIDWFKTLPLWLDLPGFRVVHACWHNDYMGEIRATDRLADDLRLTDELMVAASRPGTMEFRVVEGLLKGLEIPLPEGAGFYDKDGVWRESARIRWWDNESKTYRDLALAPRDKLTLDHVPDKYRVPYDDVKPVFFGHYWMTKELKPQAPKVACVDYSAGKGGPLVAYCWEGESELRNTQFKAVG